MVYFCSLVKVSIREKKKKARQLCDCLSEYTFLTFWCILLGHILFTVIMRIPVYPWLSAYMHSKDKDRLAHKSKTKTNLAVCSEYAWALCKLQVGT